MTREEAITAVSKARGSAVSIKWYDIREDDDSAHEAFMRESVQLVDALASLGLINLVGPKSVLQRYYDAVAPILNSSADAYAVKLKLEAAGLKIVDANKA